MVLTHIEKLIPKTIANCVSKKIIPIYGDGSNIREWIHVNDHIENLTKLSSNYISGSTIILVQDMKHQI